MPDIELNPTLTAILESRLEVGRKIVEEKAKFERYAQRKLDRFQREITVNNSKCQQALSQAMGTAIPNGAFMGMKRPGVGVVSWDGPPVEKKDAPAPAVEAEKSATITPMPAREPVAAANGEHDH